MIADRLRRLQKVFPLKFSHIGTVVTIGEVELSSTFPTLTIHDPSLYDLMETSLKYTYFFIRN